MPAETLHVDELVLRLPGVTAHVARRVAERVVADLGRALGPDAPPLELGVVRLAVDAGPGPIDEERLVRALVGAVLGHLRGRG